MSDFEYDEPVSLWESTTTVREHGVVTDVEWDCFFYVRNDPHVAAPNTDEDGS